MAIAKPPERYNAQYDTPRVRRLTLAGWSAGLFVGMVRGLFLDQYIATEEYT